MKKNFLFVFVAPAVFFLVFLIFSSCVSSQKILSFPKEDDVMMHFLSGIELKGEHVAKLSADFTFFVKDGNFSLDTTANYSIVHKKTFDASKINVGIVADGEKLYFVQKKVLFKEMQGKNLLTRFTTVLSKENSEKLKGACKIIFFIEGGDGDFYEEIEAKKFQKQLAEFLLIL